MNAQGSGVGSQPHHRVPLLARALRVLLVSGAVLAVAALAPGPVGAVSGRALLGVLIGAPLLRVAYLSVRWARLGDRRFAAVGLLLLVITVVGTVLGG